MDLDKIGSDQLSVYFVGTATLLIRCGDFTILTDPNFIHRHEQVAIGYGMHATRLTDPALEIDQLPLLDLVLLSHFHGDHFDQIAERELDKDLKIVTTKEASDELRQRGFNNLHSLDTWASVDFGKGAKGATGLKITAMPGRHGPPLSELVLPQTMGSMLEFHSPQGHAAVYITGDTLVFDAIKEIPQRYPRVDLALLHLGGRRVLGILVTMDAEQGIEMMHIIEPTQAIPIHYDDYDLFKSPLADFVEQVGKAGLDSRVRYLQRGESYQLTLRRGFGQGEPMSGDTLIGSRH
jgi:L-ascorbate metabolism protein UlaG (beta-lactamase superfamily)